MNIIRIEPFQSRQAVELLSPLILIIPIGLLQKFQELTQQVFQLHLMKNLN